MWVHTVLSIADVSALNQARAVQPFKQLCPLLHNGSFKTSTHTRGQTDRFKLMGLQEVVMESENFMYSQITLQKLKFMIAPLNDILSKLNYKYVVVLQTSAK